MMSCVVLCMMFLFDVTEWFIRKRDMEYGYIPEARCSEMPEAYMNEGESNGYKFSGKNETV